MLIPLPSRLDSPEARSRFGWTVLRVTLAILIGIHGWGRWIEGAVPPFGGFLDTLGLPGMAIAVAITAVEILGSILFAWGRQVPLLAIVYTIILAAGIVLVHGKAGWFVVGLGRNGSEYSVLLIAALLCVALQHLETGKGKA